MEPVLEMRPARLALSMVLLAALAACSQSNTDGTSPYEGLNPFQLLQQYRKSVQMDMTQIGEAQGRELRRVLEEDGQPILLVQYPRFKYLQLMAPFGQNGTVTTWSSTEFQSVVARGGMAVATRGFGDDLMIAVVPTEGQIRAGSGTTNRQHVFLDGADQQVVQNYRCTVATVGQESVAVLGRPYATRKVVERCEGSAGSFENQYWIDAGGRIRQSWQTVGPANEQILLQMVVDPKGP